MCQVHHIDPKGHDAGVVYSEMQGRENTSADLMELKCTAISYFLICLIYYRNCPSDFKDCLSLRAVDIEAKRGGL